MALTRTPRSAHSPASWRVSWMTAALDAWYAGFANSVPPMPQIEAMLTIEPDWRSSMWRPTCAGVVPHTHHVDVERLAEVLVRRLLARPSRCSR